MSVKTLIYNGMGWDSSFLNNPIIAGYDKIITYESLPFTPHYDPGQVGWKFSKNKKCFLRNLRRTFGTYKKIDGHLEFILPTCVAHKYITLEYNYSVDSTTITPPEGDVLIKGYLDQSLKWLAAMKEKGRKVFVATSTMILPTDLIGVKLHYVEFGDNDESESESESESDI